MADGAHTHDEEIEPRWARSLRHEMHHGIERILNKENRIMSQQNEINTYVQRLNDGVTAIRQEIDNLEAQNTGLDLSGLQTAVASVEGLEPPVVTVPNPSTPGSTTSGA